MNGVALIPMLQSLAAGKIGVPFLEVMSCAVTTEVANTHAIANRFFLMFFF
jgi:hypothetical protein